jgi:hypothetical protein
MRTEISIYENHDADAAVWEDLCTVLYDTEVIMKDD